MVIEHAVLQVKPGKSEQFIKAMHQAKPLIAIQPGFQSIAVRPASEDASDQFLLLVTWDKIESHRDGFRQSPEYEQWRGLLHDFYHPMPNITYFGHSIFND